MLPTAADVPALDVARAARPVRLGEVVGTVTLWAVLVIGIGIIALGALLLIDMLIPHQPKNATAVPGVFLIAVGGLLGFSAVLQSRWFTRPASPGSVDRSWMPWMLWAVVVLGIGIVALGMVGLLDLLSPHHPKTLTAAPGVFLIGLGGLVVLGPTLRLLGFGLSISRPIQAPRSAKLTPPQSRSERARTQLAIRFGVLGFLAVIVGTARQAGLGWAVVAGLATAVAFGVPVGIAWARQRGNQSQEPTPALQPPPPTLTGSITIRPTPFYRFGMAIVCLAVAGVFLQMAYQFLVQGGLGGAWLPGAFVLILIGLAVLIPTVYIRVDASTIVFGPKLPGRRTFDRREVALIRATSSPLTMRTLFLRSDGSTLWSTSGGVWGQGGLRSLADYLGVPYEG